MAIQIHKQAQRMLLLSFALMLLCAIPSYASAEIIDDISLRTDANGDVDALIKFTVPVQYLRHFPWKKSPHLVVYFNILGNVPRDQWQDYESHRAPPSDLILGFTVTTRDLNTGPKIEVDFNRPADFSVETGKDGRSMLLHIKPDKPQQKQESKSAPGLPGAVMAPPIVVPPIAVAPITAPPVAVAPAATPSVAVPGAPAAATAAQPVAVPAAKPAVASPPPATGKPAAQLGGKDGLPAFPVVEPVAPEAANVPPPENPTLADQIKRSNNQAAMFMAKGRDALLAGEMFAAVEAFNGVLNLPPNKYSQDAQLWIGIAREKSGQSVKAKLEYESYLKLYPNGTSTPWVKDRLAKLNAIFPSQAAPQAAPVKAPSTEFQTTEYGSYSMYYYRGASHTDTIATVANVPTPTSLTLTDQSTLINNVSLTARSYNNEFDNRLVFQDFYAANFLRGQQNKNRLNSAYLEIRNRTDDYSARVGRQSALGGGVLGRFDGVTAGYGLSPDWRANVVAGRLADLTLGPKPVFYGASIDFGVKDPLGGSLYGINQKVGGIADRQAVGGYLRYFDQRKTAIAMLDYDVQFKQMNMLTMQGTLNGESGTDFNFLLDRRKSPSLGIRSAVNGTVASIDTLRLNGWTQNDLLTLAKLRTAVSNMGQLGMTNHLSEKWQVGTDIVVANTSGMAQSGTLNPDFTTGVEGFVPASPATGNTWTISERVIGNDLISSHGISMASVSYTKSHLLAGKMLLLNDHSLLRELWTLDSTLRLYWQTDKLGGKQNIIAPVMKVGYRVKTSLTVEAEGGVEMTKATPNALQSSKTNRKYVSFGFRWDF